MTTTVTFVVFVLSVAAIPGSLLAKGKSTTGDAQPPEINIMPGANQLPDIILAVSLIMPRGPKDLIEDYEGEMQAITGRFANELTFISHAADENQMSGQQAEEISKERFQVAMMQFQLLAALRANLEREIDRAEQTAQRDSRPSQEDLSAVVELPFSSLQLNPRLIRYLQLSFFQAAAIQDVMSRERQNIDPMMADLRMTSEKLFRANQQGYTDSKEVRVLATSQATILSRLIVANSRMQAKIYSLLNGEQLKKLEHLRQSDKVAVLDEQ